MSWRIPIPRGRMLELGASQQFRDMLLLCRAANMVRFAITAGTELGEQNDPAAFRQRLASYFVTSAALEEAFLLVERIGRSLNGMPSWPKLTELRRAPETKSLRRAVLDRLRNKAVFHHDDVVVERGLFLLGDGDCSLAESASSSLLDVHYDLADRAALAYAIEEFTQPADRNAVNRLIEASLDLGSEFLQAADAVIGEVASAVGLEVSVDE